MIQINLTDTGVHAELARLVNAFDNPQPALKSIGELVVEFTKTRFEVSQDPYGKPWAPNTDTTLRRMLHGNAKNFTKVKGRLSARGQLALSSKKPLIGESKSLSTQFAWRLVGDGVEIRSTMIYAAMQQFGGKKADFPNLWGDIPARPFFP
jgi:phage gpG-like protein